MSINGTAQTEYASLSGKIHTFVVDKTLSISGACADAKATGEAVETAVNSVKAESAEYAIEKSLEAVGDLADAVARKAAVDAVADEVGKAVDALAILSAEEVEGICTSGNTDATEKLLSGVGLAELWSMTKAVDRTKAMVETGSYTGTGGAITLTFNHKPQIVVISNMKNLNNTSGFVVFPRGAGSATVGGNGDGGYHAYASWGDKTVTVSGGNYYNPSVSGATHYYAAITEEVAE